MKNFIIVVLGLLLVWQLFNKLLFHCPCDNCKSDYCPAKNCPKIIKIQRRESWSNSLLVLWVAVLSPWLYHLCYSSSLFLGIKGDENEEVSNLDDNCSLLWICIGMVWRFTILSFLIDFQSIIKKPLCWRQGGFLFVYK